MSKVKINVASGGVIEKPVITCFQGTKGNYVVLDNEANGSMGLPIICICKFDGTKLIKIIDNNEWAGVKGDLKTIISGSNFPCLNVPDTLEAADDFYTQLTLPVASFDLLKNAYVPITAEAAEEAPAAPETAPEAPAVEAAPAEETPAAPEASVISDPSALGSIAPVEAAPVAPEAPVAPAPVDIPVAPETAPVAPAETPVVPVETPAEVPAVPEAPSIDIPTIPAEPAAPADVAPAAEVTPEAPAAPEISIPEMAAPIETAAPAPEAPSLPEIDVPVIGNGSVSEEPVSMMIPDPTATDVPVAPVTTSEPIAEPTQEMVNNTFVGESDDIETIKENFMKSCETMFDALIKKFQDK